uniref:hypothetical protein n=1 Tax=Vibrio cholerae TaxID=666 RepID=UPI003F5853AA
MTKALGVELSRLRLEVKTEQRHELMSDAISNAKRLEQSGQQKEADKLIVSTYNKLSHSAKKEYSQYQPRPEHQKSISQAQSREKERQAASSIQHQQHSEKESTATKTSQLVVENYIQENEETEMKKAILAVATASMLSWLGVLPTLIESMA